MSVDEIREHEHQCYELDQHEWVEWDGSRRGLGLLCNWCFITKPLTPDVVDDEEATLSALMREDLDAAATRSTLPTSVLVLIALVLLVTL